MATTSVLVEAFAQLTSSDSKLDALEALIQELTPYQWRFVQSRINSRTFHFDIIRRLPVELISHIFSYLDTTAPWQLQHVSRSWFHNLRSLAVLKPGLDRWYHGTVDLHGVDVRFCWHKACSIHAFRKAALPDSSFKIVAPFMAMHHVLCGDHLVWLAEHRRSVHVLNLRTLHTKALVPANRELLQGISASDDLVTLRAQSSGLVYIGQLSGLNPLKKFRFITLTQCFSMTCRRRMVACTAMQSDGLLVYIWNYDTEQGRSFTVTSDIPFFAGDHSSFLKSVVATTSLIQPETQTIVLCLLVQIQSQSNVTGASNQLLCHKFSFSGKCLHGTRLVLEGQGHDPDQILNTVKFTPANHNGLFMLRCASTASRRDNTSAVYSLQFDEKLHTLTRPQHPKFCSVDGHENSNIVWWQDTFIEAGTKDRIIVHRGTISDPRNDSIIACDPVRLMTRTDQSIDSRQLLVNDRYMVRPYRGAFYVYCFDHTLHLPGKEGLLGVGLWEVIEPEFASVNDCPPV